jgi:hypothetical protein
VSWYNGEWVETADDVLIIRDWCPTCDPHGVPDPYTLKPCGLHTPSVDGDADEQARGGGDSFWLSGSTDVDGRVNSKWCRLFHRPPE